MVTKVTRLLDTPHFLTITLNRFQIDQQTKQPFKILSEVQLPCDLSLLGSNQSGAALPAAGQSELGEYRIYAVIIHRGDTLNGGHYYTLVRALDEGGDEVWRVYDDADVTTHSWDDLQQLVSSGSQDTPYVLFYERVGGTVSGNESLAHHVKDMVEEDNMQFASEKLAVKMAAGNQGGNQAASPLAGGRAGVSCGDRWSTIGAGRYVRLLANCQSAQLAGSKAVIIF